MWAGCGRKRAFDGYAFIANRDGHAIAAVDLSAFAVVRHIALGAAPTAVIAPPSRPFVYALTPGSGTVHEIALRGLAVTRTRQVARAAVSMRLTADANSLWVLCREPRRLVRLDLDGFSSGAQIPLPLDPTDFDVSRWRDLAAVCYGPEGSVQLIALGPGKASAPIRLSRHVGLARFRSDGKALLVANVADRMLSVLQAPEGRVVTHLPLAVRPDHFCFNRDGGQLFVTGEGRDAVVVLYPYNTPQVAETALGGHAPAAMAASENFLFIANPASGDVTIMNIETRRVIAVTAVGREPRYITVTPNDDYALVLNEQSGDMAVIRIGGIRQNRAKSVALLTMIPVGSRPVSAAVRALV